VAKKLFVFMFAVIIICAGVSSALDVEAEKAKLTSDQIDFTFGLGWAGNEVVGGITRDGLDYPKASFGINPYLGLTYAWIFGAPSKKAINNAVDEVVVENKGADNLRDYDLKLLTKRKLNINSYTFFRLGTAYLYLPLVVQYGWMLPVGDVGRFQLGLGLPLLLNVGMNFDF